MKQCLVLGTPHKEDWPECVPLAVKKGITFQSFKRMNLVDLMPDACGEAIWVLDQIF